MSETLAYCADDEVLAEKTTRRDEWTYYRCPECEESGKVRRGENGGLTAGFGDGGWSPLVFTTDDVDRSALPDAVAAALDADDETEEAGDSE